MVAVLALLVETDVAAQERRLLLVETDVVSQERRLRDCVTGQRTLKGLILLRVDFSIFYCGVGHVVGAL